MLKSIQFSAQSILIGFLALFLLCVAASFYTDFLPLIVLPFLFLFLAYVALDIELPFKLLLLSIPFSIDLEKVLPVQLDFPDEAFQLIVTLLMLFYFIIKRPYYTKEFITHPLIILILISFLWIGVCTYTSVNVPLSLKFFVKKIWYLVPFVFFAYAFFQKRNNIKTGFKAMYLVLVALILLVMYKAKGVGFSFNDVHDPIQPFFRNHVMYGSMISSFLFCVVGAFLNGRKGSVAKLFIGLSILLFLVAIYFSYSRGAWAATIFGFGIMLLVKWRKVHWGMGAFYALVLALIIFLSYQNKYLQYRPKFERTVMHESLADHLMATIQGTDISSAERYYRWIAAIRMSQDHPIVGVGPNNFYDTYQSYTISAFKTWVSRNLERSTTHNYFLFMLVEQGYVGMILYAILIFYIFYRGQIVYHKLDDRYEKNLVLAVLGMISAIFINNFFSELLETDKIGSLFYMGVTLLVVYDIKSFKRTA